MLFKLKKTHNNSELSVVHKGHEVILSGWISDIRNIGKIIFMNLRDSFGFTQIKFIQGTDVYKLARSLKRESYISIKGIVDIRENVNTDLDTGFIEIDVQELEILSRSQTVTNTSNKKFNSNIRFLNLRKQKYQSNMIIKRLLTDSIRDFLKKETILEITTPSLVNPVFNKLNDLLIPSRNNKNLFYTLPSSLDIFRELLVISGFENHFQIEKIFNSRTDRFEFTQLDIGRTFVEPKDIMDLTESLINVLVNLLSGVKTCVPFKTMTHKEALSIYGTTKPDTRFGLLLHDVSETCAKTDFPVFLTSIVDEGMIVKAINVKNLADKYSRSKINNLDTFARIFDNKGIFSIKMVDGSFSGTIVKYLSSEVQEELTKQLEIEDNDLIIFAVNYADVVNKTLSELRLKLAKDNDLIQSIELDFVWVTDWPLFNNDAGQCELAHSLLALPKGEEYLSEDLTYSYNLNINGELVGEGSLMNTSYDDMREIFSILDFSEKKQFEKYGFLLTALKYGVPPHGGIGINLDKLFKYLMGMDNIDDIILFPKTNNGKCLTTNTPNKK